MSPTPAPPRIAYLCTDLLFTSKIRETVRALGCEAVAARDLSSLAKAVERAALVIVDLRRGDAPEALQQLRSRVVAEEMSQGVIGFCDHERVDLFEQARAAGCRPYAKGKFSSGLAEIIASVVDLPSLPDVPTGAPEASPGAATPIPTAGI